MRYCLFIFFELFLLQACSKSEKPETVAMHFIKAMQQEDFSTAKDYVTSESSDLLNGLNMTKGKHLFPLKPDDTVIIKKVVQSNDSCFVFLKTQNNLPFKVVLYKQFTGWKVAYDMQTLMKSAFDETP